MSDNEQAHWEAIDRLAKQIAAEVVEIHEKNGCPCDG